MANSIVARNTRGKKCAATKLAEKIEFYIKKLKSMEKQLVLLSQSENKRTIPVTFCEVSGVHMPVTASIKVKVNYSKILFRCLLEGLEYADVPHITTDRLMKIGLLLQKRARRARALTRQIHSQIDRQNS
ncbi:hypothetical protein X975_01912, partial [Stegodyphus mimosarum]